MWLNSEEAPPTFQRGSQPIDGIFCAPQLLDLASGGYFGFDKAIPSNHQAIWLDLYILQVCPQQQEPHVKPAARRLKCNDPRIVEKYNVALVNLFNSHNIMQRVTQLGRDLQGPQDLWQHRRIELNAVDQIIMSAKKGTENQW